jgi:hypothetical protein
MKTGVVHHFLRTLSSAILVGLLFSTSSIFTLFTPVARAASAPNIISYQGRLMNANAVPLSTSTASMVFEFYTAASGGSCVWSNSSATCASATARTVTLTDGLFSENLGDTTAGTPYAAITDDIFGNNAALFLQVTVNGEALSPRKQIVAAPYALNSDTLDGLDADTDGATSSAIPALNSSGALVITGNPSGSSVSGGSVYVNPASSDMSANDTIFGVADGGTERFRIDKEGDVYVKGIALNSTGTGPTDSGASLIGAFDELTYSSASNLQDIIDDLDTAIGTISGGASYWTDATTFTYLTATTEDLVLGDSTIAGGSLYFDTSTGHLYLGTDDTLNGTLTLYSTSGGFDPMISTAVTGGLFYEATGHVFVDDADHTLASVLDDGLVGHVESTNGYTTAAATGLDTSSAGALTLGNTTATSVSVCNSASCDTLSLGTNADADTISLGDASDTVSLTASSWSLSSGGVLTLSAGSSQTTALVITDTDYTNSLSIADNDIIGTTAAIDFTNFDVSANGRITVAGGVGLDASGGGALAIGGNTTGTLEICESATCDTVGIATNADADTVNIGDANDAVNFRGDFLFTLAPAADNDDTINASMTMATDYSSNVLNLDITNTAATSAGENYFIKLRNQNDPGSTGTPDGYIYIEQRDADEFVGSGISFFSLTNGGLGTAVDASDSNINVALEVGTNPINGTTGAINYTNFDVAATGAITVAAGVGLDTNGAGALLLGNTNATSVSTCNSAACDTITIATNTDADTITIGDSNDTLTLNGGSSSAIDFANFDVATSGTITVAAGTGLDTNGSGALNLGSTNATSLGLCDSAACDSISLGTNTDADAINIGDANDTLTLAGDIAVSLVSSGSFDDNFSINHTHATDVSNSSLRINFTDTAASDSGTNYLAHLFLNDDGGSTGVPDAFLQIDSADSNETVATGIGFSVINTNGLTTAIDATDTNIVTALSVGTNDIVGTTGLINYTNFDVASTGAITVAAGVGLDTNSAGTLLLGGGNATTLSACNSAACDTINIGTNSDADTITIGDLNDTNAILGTTWSISATGVLTMSAIGSQTTAIVVSDTDYTNALSLGDNNIIGTTAAIDFTNFDVSATGGIIAADDLIIGGTTLSNGSLTVDVSANNIRLGTGSTANVDLDFYGSDGDTGQLVYNTSDTWTFTGGDISHIGTGTLPTAASGSQITGLTQATFTGTSNNTLGVITLTGAEGLLDYSAVEGTATDHQVNGVYGNINTSGSTANFSYMSGVFGRVTNTATTLTPIPTAGGYLAGVFGDAAQNAATTISNVYGTAGRVTANTGTITTGVAVYGEIVSGSGVMTSAYGGQFLNTTEGTTRYGVYAQASGGTTNYAGFFASGLVQIDEDGTANTPNNADSAGELYVSGDIENDSSVYFGDSTGTDTFVFTSAITSGTAASFNINEVTSGTGVDITRPNSSGDFDGTILAVVSNETSTTSDGDVLKVTNKAGDSSSNTSVALYVVQDFVNTTTGGSAGATTTPRSHAFVIDVNEAESTDDVMVIRSGAASSPDVEFIINNNGSVTADGAYSSGGADFAEYFYTEDSTLSFGHVTCPDPSTAKGVKRCEAGNADVMGVVSDSAGFIGNNIPGAGEDLSSNAHYRTVGLVGQVDTYASADDGPIAVGDPLTISSTTAGYAGHIRGPAFIIGRALEPLAAGRGKIKVLVQPQWYAGDVLSKEGDALAIAGGVKLSALAVATRLAPAENSNALTLSGSAWNGTAAEEVNIGLRNKVTTASNYRLAVENDMGGEVASFSNNGDLYVSGKFYPSDRGVSQSSAYIFYDSSAGGGYMKTNAAGWNVGSYDFAEMFPSNDALEAGDVVVFGTGVQSVAKSTGKTYDDRIVGVVSTRPGFLAGEYKAGSSPVALAGRVPTKVTTENGAIEIGDPLTSSSKPGYAMKATKAGPIIGYAMEALSGGESQIVAFVRASYYDGSGDNAAPALTPSVSGLNQNLSSLDITGVLNMNGGRILAVGALEGVSGNWSIGESGDFVTKGRVTEQVRSYAGELVNTYAVTSPQTSIELSGTATLQNGQATVAFEDIDPAFNDIISTTAPIKVLVTPAGITGQVYVMNKTADGFVIHDTGLSNGVEVDWLVIAYHKDFEPEEKVAGETVEAAEEIAPEVIPPSSTGEEISGTDEGTSPEESTPVDEILPTEEESEIMAPDSEVTPPQEP